MVWLQWCEKLEVIYTKFKGILEVDKWGIERVTIAIAYIQHYSVCLYNIIIILMMQACVCCWGEQLSPVFNKHHHSWITGGALAELVVICCACSFMTYLQLHACFTELSLSLLTNCFYNGFFFCCYLFPHANESTKIPMHTII